MKKLAITLVSMLVTLGVGAQVINPVTTGNAPTLVGSATANNCVKFSDTSGNLADAGSTCGGAPLGNNNTWTGTNTFSKAGAASASPVLLSGTLLTGGTGTTNFPNFFIQPSGATAATTWSTSGTAIGVNTASGFAGNLIDVRVAGTSQFTVSSTGIVAPAGAINGTSINLTGSVANFTNANNISCSYATTGLTCTRNIADANPVVILQQSNTGSTGDILQLKGGASGTTVVESTYYNGEKSFKGVAPAVATGAADCGTSPAITGNNVTGRVTVGSSTNGGKCTLTFANSGTGWGATAPSCVCNNETTANTCRAASTSTTTVALTGTLTAADKINYHCFGIK